MGKKKRGHPDLEEVLSRPWCYYCERDFDDLKILISHQKAKHFKCDRCGRRLNTAGGLSVHMSQVHKEQLSAVDNALPNRSSLDIEIFGMEGVPEDVLQAHNQRVITQYHQAEAERRAVTGNPAPGMPSGAQTKKPKLESASDLKKRLAEHKAKLAEKAAGTSSGGATPVSTDQGLHAGSSYATPQYPTPTNGSAQQYPYPQQFGQPAAYQQPPQTYQKQPEYPSPGYQQLPIIGQQYPAQYSSPAMSPSQYQPALAPQNPVVSTTPPLPFQQQPPHMGAHTPPQAAISMPPRPPSLPAAPGLPQRPSFSPPQVNSWQLQQMHHGQMPIPPPHAPQVPGTEAGVENAATAADRLISEESKRADELAQKPTPTPAPEEAPEGKPAKKEKAKASRLVYSDSAVSPEEKMAKLPRYAFVPERREETVLRDATTGAVARPVDASDEIVNPPE
ncbi:hypothetical protein UREG_01812 [Uncinocarpus reesii 1704]|uniref:C2H2-type domain-containing protein n=1 Tax=Uncinocarpus reesii (strain UAMH 1704) TaxID=336963 RepID=C4JJK5_UNCRE|nr:uncharacterized protein UREG_01812 [Uncinocarpus reesii 1704]EEP76963.1 hypothetical protein UREG_01812 [Uncinocarpus reesii 1704]